MLSYLERLSRGVSWRRPRRHFNPVIAEVLEERVLPAHTLGVAWEGIHDFEVVGRTAGGQWWSGGYDAQPLGSETGFQNEAFASWSGGVNWQTVRHGDFDGDGLSDVAGRDPQTGNWWITYSDGVRSTTRLGANWDRTAGWTDVAAVDFASPDDRTPGNLHFTNKADLIGRVASGQNAGWWVAAVSRGDGTFVSVSLNRWAPNAGWRDVRFLDINNDGATDVVGRTSTGNWWALRSMVDPTTREGLSYDNVLLATWNEAAGWRDVRVATDFFRDGRAAILARSSGGEWRALAFDSSGAAVTRVVGNWNEAAGWRDVSVGFGTRFLAGPSLFGRTAGGDWWRSEWTGTTFASYRIAHWEESAGWRDVQLARSRDSLQAWIVGRTASGQWWAAALSNDNRSSTNVLMGRWDESAGWRDVTVAFDKPVTRSAVAVQKRIVGDIQDILVNIQGNRAGTTVTVDNESNPAFGLFGIKVTYLVTGSAVPRETLIYETSSAFVPNRLWWLEFNGHYLADAYDNNSNKPSEALGWAGDDTFDTVNGVVDSIVGGDGVDGGQGDPGIDTFQPD